MITNGQKTGDSDRYRFGDKTLDLHYLCFGCGLAHKNVEAGGIWGCPNIACMSPGNSYFRKGLSSYKLDGKERYEEVDYPEWIEKVESVLLYKEGDPIWESDSIKPATIKSLEYLKKVEKSFRLGAKYEI